MPQMSRRGVRSDQNCGLRTADCGLKDGEMPFLRHPGPSKKPERAPRVIVAPAHSPNRSVRQDIASPRPIFNGGAATVGV